MYKLTTILILLSGCFTKVQQRQSIKTPAMVVNDSIKIPNIILIVVDDMGFEIPTCNGGQSYYTPNIDSLAAQGRRFIAMYALPNCSPSRVEILTGKYSYRNYTLWGHLDTTNRTYVNDLRDAGYNTCIAGKWQLDGGDSAIKSFGYNYYSVSMPYKDDDDNEGKSNHYKNPEVYQNGKDSQYTHGEYGENIFRQYLFDFIDSCNARGESYYAEWKPNLVHKPFSPTPDDAAFANWDPDQRPTSGDTIYYKSMVKYIDKEMGMLMQKLQGSNTYVIFMSDNGTTKGMFSLFNNKLVEGDKGNTTVAGTHIPFIIWYPQTITASRDTALHDLTDIYPTIVAIAGLQDMQLDGYDILSGYTRTWSLLHFQPQGHDDPNYKFTRAVINTRYIKYDTIAFKKNKEWRFYDRYNDPLEENAISKANQTPEQKQFRITADSILQIMK